MSSSRHPIALSAERLVGDSTRLLALVMVLPLVDGIFPALVLAGALDDPVGIIEVGVLIFGGSATIAVVLVELEGSVRERSLAVAAVGVPLIVLAGIETALAPTIGGLLNLAIFERFAGLVILAVAAHTASARVGEYIPRPAVVVGLGLVASIDLSAVAVVFDADPALMVRGMAAAGIGVAVALSVALASPWLHRVVAIDRFRFGSAVALGVLGLSIVGVIPSSAPLPLAVLAVSALFAFDPDGVGASGSPPQPAPGGLPAAFADGGGADEDRQDESPSPDPDDSVERAPWQ